MHANLSANILAIAGLFATSSALADTQYLFVSSKLRGMIQGSVTAKGLEGAIAVDSAGTQMTSPRDAKTGYATGKIVAQPLVVVVPVDKAWPILLNALTTNGILSSVQLRTMGASSTGLPVEVRRVDLSTANIIDIQEFTAGGNNGAPRQPMLRISFTYQEIQWTWSNGGSALVSSWSRPQPRPASVPASGDGPPIGPRSRASARQLRREAAGGLQTWADWECDVVA